MKSFRNLLSLNPLLNRCVERIQKEYGVKLQQKNFVGEEGRGLSKIYREGYAFESLALGVGQDKRSSLYCFRPDQKLRPDPTYELLLEYKRYIAPELQVPQIPGGFNLAPGTHFVKDEQKQHG